MNVFTLMATLTLNKAAYDKGLDDAQHKADGFGSKLMKGLGTAGKVAAGTLTAAATAAGALAKAAVNAYADYEQLVGGVETLFKESADVVQEYARRAYETAGLSANEYMETVTSFSASLLQSVGGDTAKAAKIADRAIRDMSDNANKMGTSMKSIQTAYQGFAKQNYTMLDNLKLGYGGTKTEMERLIKDAEELDETFKATRDTNGELTMSYADVVEAIGIVQTQMGITGTTALEASKTISGSVAAMKSAWANLVTGIADENADFEGLINNLVDTVGTAAENILPRIEIALGGIGKLVEGLAPIIGESLPRLVENVLPGLVGAATGLVNSMVDQLPSLASTGVSLFGTLLDNVPDILLNISGQLPSLITGIADKLTEGDTLDKMVGAGVDLFVGLVSDIPAIILALADALPRIVTGIVDGLTKQENIDKMADGLVKLFSGDWADRALIAAGEIVGSLVDAVCKLLLGEEMGAKVANAVKDMFLWAFDPSNWWASQAGAAIMESSVEGLWDTYTLNMRRSIAERKGKFFSDAELVGMTYSEAIRYGLIEDWDANADDLHGKVRGRMRDVVDETTVGDMRGRGKAVGNALSEGTEKGFKEDVGGVRKEIIAQFNLIVDAVEDEMGINSPSRVFARIGRFMADGVGVGFENKVPEIKRTLRQRMREIVGAVQNEMQIASPSKVFASIGRFMAQGLEQGWESEISSVNAAISSSIDTEYSGSAPRGGWTLNVYAPKMTPAEAFEEAQRVADDAQFLGFAPVPA